MSVEIISTIEQSIASKKFEEALEICIQHKQYYLGLFLGRIVPLSSARYYESMAEIMKNTDTAKSDIKITRREIPPELMKPEPEKVEQKVVVQKPDIVPGKIRVKLMCSWCSGNDICRLWNKMSQGNFIWNNIQIVWEDPADYYVIINAALPGETFEKKKTLVFRMEPHMSLHPEVWKEWANPNPEDFLKVFSHEKGEYNNNEWHLSRTYSELSIEKIEKKVDLQQVLSTVLSEQYRDPGHIKRIDFVKFLEKKGLLVHVYGNNKWNYKNYKGSLPRYCKDDGLLPYKYHFNAENHAIPNYYTEKLIDGILSECLTFYWGCPNIKNFIDERAFVQLSLSNFEQDYEIILKAMREDWHSKRLPYIQEAKKKILNELQFFPRLEKFINSVEKKV